MYRKVYIVQHRLLHYRTRLFDSLRKRLKDYDVELEVIHGQPSVREKNRKDEGELDWTIKVNNYYLPFGAVDLCWQKLPRKIIKSDLIILMQENRLVSNYPFLLGMRAVSSRIAYWGHGRNLQSAYPEGFRERWKKRLVNKVDWWFAYTGLTVEYLLSVGFEGDRITCLNNAIDNEKFSIELIEVKKSHIEAEKSKLGISGVEDIGLFCGSLWSAKRLDLLISSYYYIKKKNPKFVLLIVGDGPDRQKIIDLSKSEERVIWVGVKTGFDKALYYRMSKVILNPGAVGLHILDSFVAGIPMITTRGASHGPEIEYIENNRTGCITGSSPAEYSEPVIRLLKDKERYDHMVLLIKDEARKYTLDNMVENFATGIVNCLNDPK